MTILKRFKLFSYSQLSGKHNDKGLTSSSFIESTSQMAQERFGSQCTELVPLKNIFKLNRTLQLLTGPTVGQRTTNVRMKMTRTYVFARQLIKKSYGQIMETVVHFTAMKRDMNSSTTTRHLKRCGGLKSHWLLTNSQVSYQTVSYFFSSLFSLTPRLPCSIAWNRYAKSVCLLFINYARAPARFSTRRSSFKDIRWK